MNGKSKFSFSKIFYNDKFVMLFSVIVAFCIWVALPGNTEDTAYSYIKDIPISIPEIGNDLKVFYMNKDTASVRVSGNSLILRSLSKDDIEITPDDSLNEIQSADEKTVKLVAKKGSIVNDYSIIAGSIDPEEITVFVDREEEADISLTYKLNASIAENYHNDGVTLSKKTVHLKGAQSIIQKIKSAVAVCEYDGELNKTVNIEAPIKFYDDQNNEIDNIYFERKYIEADASTVNAKITVLKLKKLNIEPNIINAPNSFDPDSGIMSIEPSTVEIAVPNDETTEIDSVTTKEIDLSKVSPTNSEFDVELVLPSGVRLMNEDVTSAKVTFDAEKLESKIFTVNNIYAVNKAAGKKTTVTTKSISVTIVGEKEQLSQLKATDMTAIVDMSSSASLSGSITLNAQIKLNEKYDSCWPYWNVSENPYPVIVNVTEQESSQASAEESSE